MRRGDRPVQPRVLDPGAGVALREYAGLDHHAVLVGQGNKFELWDDAKWQQETARAITFPGGNPKVG